MPIKSGQSIAIDPSEAVREVASLILQPEYSFILVFCSIRYDLDLIAYEITNSFPSVSVIGCTTAGEMGPAGHTSGGLIALSFPREDFSFAYAYISAENVFDEPVMHSVLCDLKSRMGKLPGRFALMFGDGLSGKEEIVSRAYQREFADVPVLGGSAGDDRRYERTFVFHDGVFHQNQFLFAAVSTAYAMKPFQTHPFFGSGAPLVVTEADSSHRIIREINGRQASAEYSASVGIDPSKLGSSIFANSPFVVRINGTDFVRGIKSANQDGSLTLFCAIDKGVVLRVGRRTGLIQNRRAIFESIRQELGSIGFILGFECVMNKLEYMNSNDMDEIDRLYAEFNLSGFTTYGEQFRGLHMNHTLTGIAFGYRTGVVSVADEEPGEETNQTEIDRLKKIVDALVSHSESMNGADDSSFGIFHKTAMLETEVNSRTLSLDNALDELESVNRSLSRTKAKFRALFDLLPTPAIVSELHSGVLTDVNDRFCEIFGFKKEEVIGRATGPDGIGLWTDGSARIRFIDKIEKEGGTTQGLEVQVRNASGKLNPFIVSARIISIEDEPLIVTEFQDVGDYARKISVLRTLSEHDELTGLPNRLLILDRLQQATSHLRRNGRSMAVAYLDLDGFKDVNDRFGHKCGDNVLIEAAFRFQSCIRESDTVGRIGGDEFVVFLIEPEDVLACETTFGRLIAAINRPFILPDSRECHISVSIGYTMFPEDNSSPSVLLEHADHALYAAKRGGKDRFVRYTNELDNV